jgi:hypothetical protein
LNLAQHINIKLAGNGMEGTCVDSMMLGVEIFEFKKFACSHAPRGSLSPSCGNFCHSRDAFSTNHHKTIPSGPRVVQAIHRRFATSVAVGVAHCGNPQVVKENSPSQKLVHITENYANSSSFPRVRSRVKASFRLTSRSSIHFRLFDSDEEWREKIGNKVEQGAAEA